MYQPNLVNLKPNTKQHILLPALFTLIMKCSLTLSVYCCFISVVRGLTLTITYRSLHLFICNVLHLSKLTKAFKECLTV